MDAISQAATAFGVPAPSRFFGGSGFQSLRSRYAVENARMSSLGAAMKAESDALQIQGQRQNLERDQIEGAALDSKRQAELDDKDVAFAILESFGDRDPGDPTIVADMQRAVFKNPRLMSVEEFRTAFDGIVQLNSGSARADSQVSAVKMRGQQEYLKTKYDEIGKQLAPLESGEEGWEIDPSTKKSVMSADAKKRMEDLRAQKANLDSLLLKVTERPLAESEITGGAKQSNSALSKGQNLFK